jgi:hypothetical protein
MFLTPYSIVLTHAVTHGPAGPAFSHDHAAIPAVAVHNDAAAAATADGPAVIDVVVVHFELGLDAAAAAVAAAVPLQAAVALLRLPPFKSAVQIVASLLAKTINAPKWLQVLNLNLYCHATNPVSLPFNVIWQLGLEFYKFGDYFRRRLSWCGCCLLFLFSCRVLLVSSFCCSRVVSDLLGGSGFPPGPGGNLDTDDDTKAGMFMLRTDSRMIWRIVFRNALRNSAVLLKLV